MSDAAVDTAQRLVPAWPLGLVHRCRLASGVGYRDEVPDPLLPSDVQTVYA